MAKNEQSTNDEVTIESDLVTKMAHIISVLPELAKKGWNSGQNFNFISVEQMKKEIIPRCAELGIVMWPIKQERVIDHRDRYKNGGIVGMSTEIQLTTTWHITDGKQTLDPPPVTVGEALDAGDKAANKASTGSQKNLFKTVFGVTEKGEDNDAHEPNPQDQYTRPAQQRQTAKPKRQLTDAQKEILQLKDQARQIVVQLSEQQMCSTQDVVLQMVRDEVIPAEWEDPKKLVHREDYKKFIEAALDYVVVPELDGPSDAVAGEGSQ